MKGMLGRILSFFSDYVYAVVALVVAALLVFAWNLGYDNAAIEYELKIEKISNDHAEAIIDAQRRAKENADVQTQKLLASAIADRDALARRVQQLEAYRRSNRTADQCFEQLSECSGLVVRGEQLLRRGRTLFENR